MKTSSIAWTESTWSPWLGCTKVSAGCANCYAEGNMAVTMRRGGRIHWGPGNPRVRTTGWDVPLRLNREAAKRQLTYSVFPSLCDIFDDDYNQRETLDKWRADFFDLVGETQHLRWLILTKRPEVALDARWSERLRGLGNVWLGVTAENQETATRRLPVLLSIPCTHRLVSCEPLLGTIDLKPWLDHIDWVIAGGESGPMARPMELEWARQIRDDCSAFGTTFFFKQVGGSERSKGGDLLDGRRHRTTPFAPTAHCECRGAPMPPWSWTRGAYQK